MNEIKQTIKCDNPVIHTTWLPKGDSRYECEDVAAPCGVDMTRIVGGNFYNAEGYFCQIFQCPKCKTLKIEQGAYYQPQAMKGHVHHFKRHSKKCVKCGKEFGEKSRGLPKKIKSTPTKEKGKKKA